MMQEFLSRVQKEGYSRPTHFTVDFVNVPTPVRQYAADLLKDMRFYCEAAEFPGTQLLTQEYRYYDMQQKVVYGRTHDDLNLTFRLDRNLKVKTFIDKWQAAAYNPTTGNVNFKQDYAGTIRVSQFDEYGNSPYAIELEDCFPFQVGSVSLGWDMGGSYSKLTATFSFRTWWVVVSETVFQPKVESSSASTGEKLQDNTNALSSLSSGELPSVQDTLLKKVNTGKITKLISDKGQGLAQKYVTKLKDKFSIRI